MKYLLITLFSISLFACQKEELPTATEEWTQGSSNIEVFKTIQSSSNQSLSLSLKSESLCLSDGVLIVFGSGDDEYFRDTINAFPYEETFQVPADTEIEIHSKLEWGLGQAPQAVCVWLGEVDFSIAY